MKTQKTMLAAFLTLTSLFAVSNVNAQTATSEPASPIKVTADVVSSYVWRGVLSTLTSTPNFQPTLAYSKGPIEIGVWGSTDFVGSYKEADIYASYVAGPLKLTLTDYDWNFKDGLGNPIPYFNYKDKQTGHIFEGSVGYTGPESLPISISANVMFAGADKKATDPTKQAYSTYIELGYAFKHFSPFLGVTPSDGYYGDSYGGYTGFAVVNLGITATKSLKITDAFSLPLKATFILNPQKEDAHLVFGITF